DQEAVELVHRFSGGIPRIVNNICDNALLTGFSEDSRKITSAIIDGVVEDLDLTSVSHSSKPMSEVIINQPVENKTRPVPSNICYIRRTIEVPVRRPLKAAVGQGQYFINSKKERESETAMTFFSRVKVSKNS